MKKDLQDLIPPEDHRRVKALRDIKLLDTEDEERFDALIRGLADTLEAPIAYLALIDAERQWLKSSVGGVDRETSREHALCSHVILGKEPVVVSDASKDARFSSSPLVTGEPGLRFYAGVPISDQESGEVIGTVCIADRRVRDLTPRELAILEGFAGRVADEIHARPMVLVAYAAEDAGWAQRLVIHGSSLARQRRFDLWSGSRVASGDERERKLSEALGRSRSVVMLLSEDFLRSDFVRRETFRRRLEAREREKVEILPILVEPCAWSEIEWLANQPPWWPDGGEVVAASEVGEDRADRLFSTLVSRLEVTAEEVGRKASRDGTEEVGRSARAAVESAAPRLFLSHASEDGDSVRTLAADLRRAGLEVWLDLDELKPGDNWMERLEEALQASDAFAVYIGRIGVERWINREVRVALDRNVKDPQFRVIPILGPGADAEALPGFLAQHQWLDLRSEDADPSRIKQLVGAIFERPAEVVSLLAPGEAPFRGLLAFDPQHSHLFFGRDRETEELLHGLRRAPFLAVIGDSGSGKSSLVRAGLIPALHRGRLSDGLAQSWRTLILRPGKDPFRELANALPDLLNDPDPAQRMAIREASARQLETGIDGLCGCIGGLVPAGEHTLLVIDQFEEVFTLSTDDAERDRFIDTLLTGSDATGDRPLHVVITLRADFFSECFEHPRLPEVISANQYPVRAMSREHLMEAIQKPAAMAGVLLEPGLVEVMLLDAGEESASLALLQHMLLELWKSRRGGTLTHASYESIGRVQGALEHHAEAVFAALDAARQEQVKRLMLHLVVPGKGGAVTRRRIPLDALLPASEEGRSAERVLRHLVEQRLLTVLPGAEGADDSPDEVEVAHEALLRGWKRLRGWLEEDREFLLWRQRSAGAFLAWKESQRDPGALLRGGLLVEARRWFEQRSPDMTEEGRQFIEASLARARSILWLKRAVVGTIAGLAVVAGVFALVARGQSRKAVQSLELARAALIEVGAMTEVTGRAKAEQPEAVELKRRIAERAVRFYEGAASDPTFEAELRLEGAVARYRYGNLLSVSGGEEMIAAAAAHEQAVQTLEELIRDDPSNDEVHRELANARYWRGYGLQKSGETGLAEADYRAAVEAQRDLIESSPADAPSHLHFELGRTLNALGVALGDESQWEEARDAYLQSKVSFERATELVGDEELGGSLDSYRQGLAWSYTNLAELGHSWGRDDLDRGEERSAIVRLEESANAYREAILILEQLRSRGREFELELAVTYNNLGNVQMDLGRWDEVRAANGKAVAILEDLARPVPGIRDELGNSYLSEAEAFYSLELDDRARKAYAKAREIYDDLEPQADRVPRYRWRKALALAGLVDVGDAAARVELCNLLPKLAAGERERLSYYCQ